MRTRHLERRRSLRSEANLGVWGVHRWDSTRVWGYHDSNRQRTAGDPYSGDTVWGWGYWVTDFWLRW